MTQLGDNRPFVTQEQIAQELGISHRVLKELLEIERKLTPEIKQLLDEGTEEQVERARNGGKGNSVNAVYTEIKQMCSYNSFTNCIHFIYRLVSNYYVILKYKLYFYYKRT